MEVPWPMRLSGSAKKLVIGERPRRRVRLSCGSESICASSMGRPLKTKRKRTGHTHNYYGTYFGESVLFAERNEVISQNRTGLHANIVLLFTPIHDF